MIHRTKLVSGQARMELDSRTDQSATTWVELWWLREKDCKSEVGRMCEDIQVQCMLDVANHRLKLVLTMVCRTRYRLTLWPPDQPFFGSGRQGKRLTPPLGYHHVPATMFRIPKMWHLQTSVSFGISRAMHVGRGQSSLETCMVV